VNEKDKIKSHEYTEEKKTNQKKRWLMECLTKKTSNKNSIESMILNNCHKIYA
jgi:hypothetical protein